MVQSILIVDDSSIIRAVIKRTLRMAGLDTAQLLEAGNGQIALDILAKQRVDLVLADLNMPVMDGRELTRSIRSRETTRDLPVIVISADPSVDGMHSLAQFGVTAYLAKPFTPEAIRQTIETVMGVAHA
jgi:two-component system chemotaxis response regulator CheY